MSHSALRNRPPRRLSAGLATSLALALLLAACAPATPTGTASSKPAPVTQGASPGQAAPPAPGTAPAAGGGSAASAPAPITLKVGTLPIAEMLPLFVGKDEGLFQAEGIELELTTLAGGAAGIPALESGSLNIMYSNIVSALQAVEQGLDLRVIAPGSLNAVNRNADSSRWLVLNDSGIEKLADLRGKRLAINQLRNVNDLYTVALLDTVGLKPGDYTLTEIPFPQMVDALLNKQVDAICEVEPFITIALDSGRVRDLGSAYADIHPNFYLAHYVALKRWIDRNEDAVHRFQRAMQRSIDHVNANRDRLGDWSVQYLRLNPELKDKIAMPEWRTAMGDEYVGSIARTRDLMVRYGYLKQSLDVQPLIVRPSSQ